MPYHPASMHSRLWAARYNTWLLIKLTPKGVVFSFLFFSILFFSCLFFSVLVYAQLSGLPPAAASGLTHVCDGGRYSEGVALWDALAHHQARLHPAGHQFVSLVQRCLHQTFQVANLPSCTCLGLTSPPSSLCVSCSSLTPCVTVDKWAYHL